MNRLRRITLLLYIGLYCLPVCGQAATPVPVHWTVSVRPNPAHPGEFLTATAHAVIDPGWHLYSTVPEPDGGPSASAIVSFGRWQAAGATQEDAPVRKFDPNFNLVVGYHLKTAALSRSFFVPSDAAPGRISPILTVHYELCNDRICLPPTNAALPTALQIAPGSVRPEYAKAPAAPPVSGGCDAGLGVFLLAALGAGLLAIVTPCVFPLIPITLTNFVKQADGDRRRLVRLSLGYALGMIALYVLLGLIVAALLGAAGANRLAADPWVNLAEFAVFVLFALSFFETITLQLPANLGHLQDFSRRHGGMAGLIVMGITFVLASFTCTAPFVGTLLVSAAGGAHLRPLLGMLTFALAFSSPFLFFAIFPQWISRLPKGGVWLAQVKAVLGFIELAAALKFLSAADQVWQWKLLTQPVLLAAWALIAACAGLYLLDTLRFGITAEDERRQRLSIPRRVCALLFFLCAGYCFWGLAGRPISPYVGAFLPPAGYGGAGGATLDGLPWLTDYRTALQQAKAAHKPLLLDFTGWTCTNCRLNEKNVFPRPEVQRALANFVRVQLYTDDVNTGPANQKLQQAKFGDIALPLYGIIDPDQETVIAKTEGVISPEKFVAFLAQAKPASSFAASASQSWAAYSPAAVAAASQAGKPAIIDFTAAWCVNCKEIERDALENPAAAAALQNFVTLRADLTPWASPASVALQKQFGFTALPAIVFIDPHGREIRPLRITQRIGLAEFQKRLRLASAAN